MKPWIQYNLSILNCFIKHVWLKKERILFSQIVKNVWFVQISFQKSIHSTTVKISSSLTQSNPVTMVKMQDPTIAAASTAHKASGPCSRMSTAKSILIIN